MSAGQYRYHQGRFNALAEQSELLSSLSKLNQVQLGHYLDQTVCHMTEIVKNSYLRSVLNFYGHVLSAWRGRILCRDRRVENRLPTDSGHEHQIDVLDRLGRKCCSSIKYLQVQECTPKVDIHYRSDYTLLECKDLVDDVDPPPIDEIQQLSPEGQAEPAIMDPDEIDESILREMIFRTDFEICEHFCYISHLSELLCRQSGVWIEKLEEDFNSKYAAKILNPDPELRYRLFEEYYDASGETLQP
jgi:hypothetical protein